MWELLRQSTGSGRSSVCPGQVVLTRKGRGRAVESDLVSFIPRPHLSSVPAPPAHCGNNRLRALSRSGGVQSGVSLLPGAAQPRGTCRPLRLESERAEFKGTARGLSPFGVQGRNDGPGVRDGLRKPGRAPASCESSRSSGHVERTPRSAHLEALETRRVGDAAWHPPLPSV